MTKPGRVKRRRIRPQPPERVGEAWEWENTPYSPAGRLEYSEKVARALAWKRRRNEKYVWIASRPNRWGLAASFFGPFVVALMIWAVISLVR